MAKKQQAPRNNHKITAPDFVRGFSALEVLIAISVIGVGLFQAIRLRWVCDDSFITFRYVKNFVEGHGIVYNVGEYVEGYTHFLWLLILSLVQWIGFDQVKMSMWLGVLCYAVLLTLYLSIASKEQRYSSSNGKRRMYLPLAAVLLALNYDMCVWATGGLETSLYTLLISIAFYFWFYTTYSERRKTIVLGVVLFLITLTRPDGALFTLTALILVSAYGLKQKRSFRQIASSCALLLAPSVLVGVPYLFWKYNYYGDIFPATFYAKSAGESYFEQGFFYIGLFFRVYFFESIILFLAGSIALFHTHQRKGNVNGGEIPSSSGNKSGSPIVAATVALTIYLVIYVASVGGDFMFARFIIPILPFVYFLLERSLERLPKQMVRYAPLAGIVIAAFLFFENSLREKVLFRFDEKTGELAGNWDGEDGGATHGIADERWVYTRTRFTQNGIDWGSLDLYSQIGIFYEPIFRDLPVTVSIPGAQNMIAYYANFRNVICEYGLTDNYISHLEVTKRGRIGHEKKAPESYLRKRGVLFQFYSIVSKLPRQIPYEMAIFEIPQYGLYQIAKVIVCDKEIVNELEQRLKIMGIRPRFMRYEKILPTYITSIMPKQFLSTVENDYLGFKQVYFERYPDLEFEQQILNYIEERKKHN